MKVPLATALQRLLATCAIATHIGATCKATCYGAIFYAPACPSAVVFHLNIWMAERYKVDVKQLITVDVKYRHWQHNSVIQVTPCKHLPCRMLLPGQSHVTAAC